MFLQICNYSNKLVQSYKTSQGLVGPRTAKGYNYAQRKLIIFCHKKTLSYITLIQYLNIKNSDVSQEVIHRHKENKSRILCEALLRYSNWIFLF